jgi:hypothetical protein
MRAVQVAQFGVEHVRFTELADPVPDRGGDVHLQRGGAVGSVLGRYSARPPMVCPVTSQANDSRGL